MIDLGKKQFKRIVQSGEIEKINVYDYSFTNNEENFCLTLDVSNDEVKENSHTNITPSQLIRIKEEIAEFHKEQIEAAYEAEQFEDDPMDHEEQYHAFY